MKRLIIGFCAVAVIIGVIPFFIGGRDRIIPGMVWQGRSVGGLSRAEWSQIAKRAVSEKQREKLVLSYKMIREEWPLQDLGVHLSEDTTERIFRAGNTGNLWEDWKTRWKTLLFSDTAPIAYICDATAVAAKVETLAEQYGTAPQDSEPVFGEHHTVTFTVGKPYLRFDVSSLTAEVRQAVEDGTMAVVIPVTEERMPMITEEEAKGFNTVLSSYTTYFEPGGNRDRNIAVAIGAVSGHIVRPGERFSYNEATGSRSAANGYLEAPVMVSGKLVPDYGGGVCQVSSTLFDAVLLAGLHVEERVEHFSPVGYIPLGQDATVAEGYIDFVFVNDGKHPLLVYGVYGPGVITLYLIGDAEDRPTYAAILPQYAESIPFKTVVKIDSAQKETEKKEEGYEGYKVGVLQTAHWADGRAVNRVFASYYEPVDTMITYNRKPADMSLGNQRVREKEANRDKVKKNQSEEKRKIDQSVSVSDKLKIIKESNGSDTKKRSS